MHDTLRPSPFLEPCQHEFVPTSDEAMVVAVARAIGGSRVRNDVVRFAGGNRSRCCDSSSASPVRFASSRAASNDVDGSRKEGRSIETPLPRPVQRQRVLIDPKPTWGWKAEEVDIALNNSRLRKGAFREADAHHLKEIREQAVMASSTNDKPSAKERAELGQQIKSIMMSLETVTGEERMAKEQEVQALRAQAQVHKQHALSKLQKTDALNEESMRIRLMMPNRTHPDVPIGDISQAKVIGVGGNLRLLPEAIQDAIRNEAVGRLLGELGQVEEQQADDERDHLSLAFRLGWVDQQASNTVTGPSWPFLIGPLAALEHALVNYAMDRATKVGFTPVVVPDVVKRDILGRTGFSPREDEAGQVYWVQPDGKRRGAQHLPEENDLALAATAEITLGGLCAGNTYEAAQLPIRLVASSHAFRAEAGARGHDSRGLYRVHQFTKVEMFVVCARSDSEQWLEDLRSVQEDLIGGLGIPYRVLDMPTEELGASAYRKYDIEAWMPGRGSWGEVSSTSNCTDYQSRRLMVRYRVGKVMLSADKGAQDMSHNPSDTQAQLPLSMEKASLKAGEGQDWAHTLNGTAVAVPRMIVALLENYGITADNRLRLPVSLRRYWIPSDSHSVEWIGKHSDGAGRTSQDTLDGNKKPSMFSSAVGQVRRIAHRNGTDPASMVVSFMILHEVTAVIPLLLLFWLLGLFGTGGAVMQWLMDASATQTSSRAGSNESGTMDNARAWLRSYIHEGMQRAERYGRKKGYFGFEKGSTPDDVNVTSDTPNVQALAGTFANFVAAYAITKALFPLRLAASVALAAPFARLCIEPLKRIVRRRSKA